MSSSQRDWKEIPVELWQEHILPQLGTLSDLSAWQQSSSFGYDVAKSTPILDRILLSYGDECKRLEFVKKLLDMILSDVHSPEDMLSPKVMKRVSQFLEAIGVNHKIDVIVYLWRSKKTVPVHLFDHVLSNPALNLGELTYLIWGGLQDPRKVVLFERLLDDQRYRPSSSLFCSACQYGHTSIVKRLLDEHFNYMDIIEEEWNEPFWQACANGHLDIVRLLLHENGMDPTRYHDWQVHHDITMDGDPDENWHTRSPFSEACNNGHIEIVRLLIADGRVDPAADNCEGLICAADQGHLELVQLLLDEERCRDFSHWKVLSAASKKGHLATVTCLLEDYAMDPSEKDNLAFRLACEYGHVALMTYLLADDRVDPTDVNNDAFTRASGKGQMEIVRRLKADPRVSKVGNEYQALSNACKEGRLDMVQFLLQIGVDPSSANVANPIARAVENGQASVFRGVGVHSSSPNVTNPIARAAENGHVRVVNVLMKDDRVDPSGFDNEAIRRACQNGHVEVVRALLSDPRVDPSARDQECILKVCQIENDGHDGDSNYDSDDEQDGPDDVTVTQRDNVGATEIVRLLLQDRRVNPNVENNTPLLDACQNGHTGIVALLLAQDKVDPADNKNDAIITAAMYGHTEIVRLLLADKRVNPSDALFAPCETGHTSIIRLLLADPRVDPTRNDHECLVKACSNGYPKTVRLLLDDGRAHPMPENSKDTALNATITSYCEAAITIFRMLVEDPRVNLSRDGHKIFQMAKDHAYNIEIIQIIFEKCRHTLSEDEQKNVRRDYAFWDIWSNTSDPSEKENSDSDLNDCEEESEKEEESSSFTFGNDPNAHEAVQPVPFTFTPTSWQSSDTTFRSDLFSFGGAKVNKAAEVVPVQGKESSLATNASTATASTAITSVTKDMFIFRATRTSLPKQDKTHQR